MVLPYLKGFLYILVSLFLWMFLDILSSRVYSLYMFITSDIKALFGPKENNFFRVFGGEKEDDLIQVGF